MPIAQYLAAKLNSKAYGVGIIGFVTSAMVERERVEVWPVSETRSDHPAYVIRVNVPASRPKAPAKKRLAATGLAARKSHRPHLTRNRVGWGGFRAS